MQARMSIQVLLGLAWPLCFNSQAAENLQRAPAWRLVNEEAVEIAWRVRTLQFFEDQACTQPLTASPNQTGDAFGTEASEMTGPEYVFALQSPRGWETLDHCLPGQCYLGFDWRTEKVAVGCIMLQQGEAGFHAPSISLQWRPASEAEAVIENWQTVVTWHSVSAGRVKLALSCPAAPAVDRATVFDCRRDGPRAQECRVQCDEGHGTLEPKMSCLNGAWFTPQCLPLGSLIRLVPELPERMSPYWVVLDATLFSSADCSNPIRMEGAAMSSGEFVIKYASYHPKNAWDADDSTSWASKGPCEASGPCWFGFRFHQDPGPIRCVELVHPEGEQYQARQVIMQKLGTTGWEEVEDVRFRLLPKGSQEL